jgi:GT2 family glycosyltransferase
MDMIVENPRLAPKRLGSDNSNKVLCVILSFNGCDDTIDCLNSLCIDLPEGFELLVVDNASNGDVVACLRETFPSVEILALPENLGWAGGNNMGVRLGLERGYDWICFLNNDTVFPAGEAHRLIASLRTLPPCLLHPSLYYWDEPGTAQLNPALKTGHDPADTSQFWNGMIRMDYAYGACLSVHADIFEHIGLLDERFFLQLEETDFYLRAAQVGFLSVCDPSIKVFHRESRAFGGTRTPAKTYYITRNSLLLIEKKRGSLFSKFFALKGVYWSLSTVSVETNESAGTGLAHFLRWIISDKVFARAARYGILNYVCRRFGKMPARYTAKLKSQ